MRIKRCYLLAIICLMFIGFASLATTLIVNGTIHFGYDKLALENDLQFTNYRFTDGNVLSSGAIDDSRKVITFFTDDFATKGDSSKFEFEVTNYNLSYDANASVECHVNEGIYADYIDVDLEGTEYFIEAGKSITDNVAITLVKSTITLEEAKEINIECTINAYASSRNSLGVLDHSDLFQLNGTFKDDNDNPVGGAMLTMFSEKKVVRTNPDGTFQINNIEDGDHHIYYIDGATYEDVITLDESDISDIATSNVELNIRNIDNEKVIDMTNDYKIDLDVQEMPNTVDYSRYFDINSIGEISLKNEILNGGIDDAAYYSALENWLKTNGSNISSTQDFDDSIVIPVYAEMYVADNGGNYEDVLMLVNKIYNTPDIKKLITMSSIQYLLSTVLNGSNSKELKNIVSYIRNVNSTTSLKNEFQSKCIALLESKIPSEAIVSDDYCNDIGKCDWEKYESDYTNIIEVLNIPVRLDYTSELFNEFRKLSTIVIPDYINGIKVTKILPNAFKGVKNIRTISIPDTVTSIGSYAFADSGIVEIALPNKLTTLGDYVFANTRLERIGLSPALKTMGSYLFSGTRIKEVFIPKNVSSIASASFSGMTLNKLEVDKANTYYETYGEVNLVDTKAKKLLFGETFKGMPTYVTTIGQSAFFKFDSDVAKIPSSIISIESYAFRDINLKEIVFPNNSITFGSSVFKSNGDLTFTYNSDGKLDINKAVSASSCTNKILNVVEGSTKFTTTIKFAFKELYIPKSVTNITGACFNAGYTIGDVHINQQNIKYKDDNNTIVDFTTNTLVTGWNNNYIPAYIKIIGSEAFAQRNQITSIEIPEGVTAVKSSALYYLAKLTSVTIPKTVNEFKSGVLYHSDKLTTINCDSDNQYYYSKNNVLIQKSNKEMVASATNAEIPAGEVEIIGNYVYNSNSYHINGVIPEGVLIVGTNSYVSSGVKDLVISSTVQKIDYSNTENLSKYNSITVNKNNAYYSDCDDYVLYEKSTNTLLKATKSSINYIPAGTKILNEDALYSLNIKDLILPESLEEIGWWAVYGNNIENIFIPKNVKIIDNYCHFETNPLKQITVDKANSKFTDLDSNGLFEKKSNGKYKLLYAAQGTKLPEGVDELGSYAYINKNITSGTAVVEIPLSLKSLNISNIYYATSIIYNEVEYTSLSEFKAAYKENGGSISGTTIKGMEE